MRNTALGCRAVERRLIHLASGLTAELGLERVITLAISVSPEGVGTPVHFDGLEVVIIRIAGSKRWRYTHNASVEAANFPLFPGERGPGVRGGQGSVACSCRGFLAP